MLEPPQDTQVPSILRLAEQLIAVTHDGPIWSYGGDQLNINVLRFRQGDGIPAHRNAEVDVMIFVVAGSAEMTLDGATTQLEAGALVVIPRGSERALSALTPELVYITCHQRRQGLQPTFPPASAS